MSETEPPVIKQLPDQVANQIAAGEVIERPAAVVKELVENSLDAGATAIEIAIEDGGRRLVAVTDDGHGMRPDDLLTAMGRHATSKLGGPDDLFKIGTLGFRGEALPSIAAVSEFSMASRPAGVDEGAILKVDGGTPQPVRTHAMPKGTRLEVRNLFWNVPARLKFLKAASAETAAISDMLTRLALGHPAVGFKLINEKGTQFEVVPGQSLVDRMRAVLGKDAAFAMLPVESVGESTQIHGFCAPPGHARPTAKRQFVYLNGRHIHDKVIVAAIREGYKGFLEPRMHGVVVLHIDTDPGMVDVNVHPTKSEVRFRRQREIFGLVKRGIGEALDLDRGPTDLFAEKPEESPVDPIVNRKVVKSPAAVPSASELSTDPALQERFLPRQPVVRQSPPPVDPQTIPTASAVAEGGNDTYQVPTEAPAVATTPEIDLPGIRQVVQLADTFVLVETDDGVRIIDQHALHEKALFLALDPSVTDLNAGGTQELFIPRSVELDAHEVAAVEPHLPKLAEVGIEAEVFGPTQLLVRRHPAILKRLNWTAFFSDLSEAGEDVDPLASLRERIAHRKACHTAIKANHKLSRPEMMELVKLLYTVENVEHCPHGRPTTLDISWMELEKRFQR